MKYFKSKVVKASIFFVAFIFLVIIGLYAYSQQQEARLHESTEMTLGEIMEQQMFHFNSSIEAEKAILHNLAMAVSYATDGETAQVMLADSLEKNISKFDMFVVSNIKGKGITNTGEVVDVMEQDFYQKAINGEEAITNPRTIIKGKEAVITLSVPIKKENEIVGVLTGTYETGKLDEMLLSSFQGMGYTFVVTRQGEILIHTESEYVLVKEGNLFEQFQKVEIYNYDKLPDLVSKMERGEAGRIEYGVEGQLRHARYSPIANTDWYIFTVVPENVIAVSHSAILKSTIFLIIFIVLSFLLLITYILCILRKNAKQSNLHTKELEKVAYYDELTGLPNLNRFKKDATEILQKNIETNFVAVKIDIIDFKRMNQLYGFEKGDIMIKKIATIISEIRAKRGLDKKGCFARITADEFIILDEGKTVEETEERRKNFEAIFNKEMESLIGQQKLKIRYGRYLLEKGEKDIKEVIERVNFAHRIAKKEKKGRIFDYNYKVRERMLYEAELEDCAPEALNNEEFKIFLQPKYSLLDETIAGAEALVRWKRKDGTLISPGVFIPLLEKNGFIIKLDFYMFEKACQVIRGWLDKGYEPVPISVNFSRLHLVNPNFLKKLKEIAQKYQIPTYLLEVELIENTILKNEKELIGLCKKLHEEGFTLSMDDFGAGYSSLGLLKNLEVDVIKIDKSFFEDGSMSRRTNAVIENVIRMAKELKIKIVAEGVETEDYIELLRESGCDMVQGYYYARPMPAEEIVLAKTELVNIK